MTAPTPSTATARARDWIGASVIGSVLVVILTYPTAAMFATGGRMDSGDGQFSIWNVAWVAHALLTSPTHILDANIFYPHPGTLAYSELNLTAGVFGLPVYAITGNALAAHNAALLLGFFVTFLSTWALVRHLTGSSGAGLVSATAFTFCPYVTAHTAHIQLVMLFTFPMVFFAFHRLRARTTWRRGGVLGIAIAVAGLTCAYYGIFAGLGLGVVALVLAEGRVRYWAALALAMTTAAALTLPVFIPYQRARLAAGPGSTRTLADSAAYSATWATYRSSPSMVHSALPGIGPQNESVFPGVTVIGCAVLGLWVAMRRMKTGDPDRRIIAAYVVMGGLALWASFGPAAHLYGWLTDVFPPMSLLRTPVRFGALVVFALAVIAGYGVRELSRTWRWAPVLLVPLVAIELAAVPWPLRAAPPIARVYTVLAQLPKGPLVEFLFPYRSSDFWSHSKYMFASTFHWMPLINGYSDVIPEDFYGIATPINEFPDPASFAILKARQARYVIWHIGDRGYSSAEQQVIQARIDRYAPYLRKITTDANSWLYEIVGWPPESAAPGGVK